MKILIDTNIYLNFYRMSKQSLASLTSLMELIKNRKIEIILPEQIEDEFYRDKNIASKDFVSNLKKLHVGNEFCSDKNIASKKSELDIKTPTFLRTYKGIKKLKALGTKLKKIEDEKIKNINNINRKLERIKKDILSEHNKRIFNDKSEINFKIKQIFDLSIKPAENGKILQKAYFRTLRGNPPRKNNSSFGDAIIWETILENYSDKKLVIISGDGDFSSEINKEKINEFLEREWKNRNGKEIKLFTNFGEFINSFTKKHIVKDEIIEEEKRANIRDNDIARCISDVGSRISNIGLDSGIINKRMQYVVDPLVPSVEDYVSTKDLFRPALDNPFEYRENIIGHQKVCTTGVNKLCSVCGKSYCENFIDASNISENKCPECKDKSL